MDTWPVQAAHADPHAVVGIMHEIMPRTNSEMTILSLSGHDRDTDEWSIGVGINLWGPYACWFMLVHVGSCWSGSYKYGALFLRPNIIIDDADRHQPDHEGKTINGQARRPEASFGNKVSAIFQRLAKTKQVCHVFLPRELVGMIEH